MPDGTLSLGSNTFSQSVRFGPDNLGLLLQPDDVLYAPAKQEESSGAYQYGETVDGLHLISGTNGSGRNFAGWDLSGLSLDGSDFSSSNLTGADLGGTSFLMSDLDDLIGVGAQLVNASIAYSASRNSNFNQSSWNFSSLANADLKGSSFRDADFRFSNLTSTDLRNADLRGANLTDGNAIECDLRGADLRGANLTNLDLTEAKLNGALIDSTTLFCNTVMPNGSVQHHQGGLCPGQPSFTFDPIPRPLSLLFAEV